MTALKNQFRVFDTQKNRYSEHAHYLGEDGELSQFVPGGYEKTDMEIERSDEGRYLTEFCVGFSDIKKNPIYDGDTWIMKSETKINIATGKEHHNPSWKKGYIYWNEAKGWQIVITEQHNAIFCDLPVEKDFTPLDASFMEITGNIHGAQF